MRLRCVWISGSNPLKNGFRPSALAQQIAQPVPDFLAHIFGALFLPAPDIGPVEQPWQPHLRLITVDGMGIDDEAVVARRTFSFMRQH